MREAIIHLDDAQLSAIGLADVVAATREAGLRDVTELVCHGTGGILEIRVEESIPAERLDGFEAVEWWERLAAPGDDVTYLCKVDAPDHGGEEPLDEHATAHEVVAVGDRGFDLSVVGSHEDISRSVAAVDDAGMNPLLERLTDYGGPTSPLSALTDRQREVVETAYGLGYYDVPRAATAEAVADELDLDPSTVSEHLQRAERNIVGGLLEPSG